MLGSEPVSLVLSGTGCQHIPLEGHSSGVDRSCPDCDDVIDELLGYAACEVCGRRFDDDDTFYFSHPSENFDLVAVVCDACHEKGS